MNKVHRSHIVIQHIHYPEQNRSNEHMTNYLFLSQVCSLKITIITIAVLSQEWGVSFEQGQGEIWGALVLSIQLQWERGKIKRVAGSFISTEPLSHDNNTQEHTHTHTQRPKHMWAH